MPDKLEKQASLFNDQKIGLVYSAISLHFIEANISYNTIPKKRGLIYKDMLIKNYIGGTVSVIVRRDALFKISQDSWFDPIFPAREEYDLWIRICAKWYVNYIDEPLVIAFYRNNLKRISNDINNYEKAIKYLNRKYKSTIDKYLSKKEKQIRISQQMFFLASQSIKLGNNRLARQYFWKSFLIKRNTMALFSFCLCLLGVDAVLKARSIFKSKVLR